MRRSGLAVATFVGVLSLASASGAHADPTVPPAPPPPAATASAVPAALAPLPAPTPSSPPPAAPSPAAPAQAAAAPGGIAVVAMPGATDVAWPLAQSVYSTPAIRPYSVDEMHARVLCGEAPAPTAPGDVRDLAETVAALRGEDAASRAILADMAHRLNVRALVVVHVEAGKPVARVFVADTQAFDAASYGPDTATAAVAWSATTASLSRTYGAAPFAPTVGAVATTPLAAPPLATHEEPVVANPPPKPKAFYESGWFWGALGAAAFAGGAVFFATRDNGASSIHLDMQVPH